MSHQPETFAQLLAKAAPGPYSHQQIKGICGQRDGHYVSNRDRSFCVDCCASASHAQLIAGLLNFAHAGGEAGLLAAIDRIEHLSESAGIKSECGTVRMLRGLLEILNNPTK